jgi:hypothetical protein
MALPVAKMSIADTKPASDNATYANRLMQPSKLLLLPREMQDMVIDSVESQQDLSALSKTCLELREAVLPFLFRNVQLPADQHIIQLLRILSESREHIRFADMIETSKLHATSFRSHSSVRELIRSTPRLTRLELHYMLDQSEEASPYTPSISAKPLSFALASVKNTLQHLKIGYKTIFNKIRLGPGTVIGFCSLKQLHHLQTVDIPFRVLLGHGLDGPTLADVLPRSLRSLKFGDDASIIQPLDWNEGIVMMEFDEYLGDGLWKETTPELNAVTISLCSYYELYGNGVARGWRPDGGERKFRQLCAENGLKCDVIHYRF